MAYGALLDETGDDWFLREVRLYWKRALKRVDVTARSLFALIEPGSCFAGFLAELVFAADRAYMFAGSRSGDKSASGEHDGTVSRRNAKISQPKSPLDRLMW